MSDEKSFFKYAVITPFLSQTKDRFHTYNRQLNLEEKFALAAQIPENSGVEIVYPYEVSSPKDTLELLKKYDLEVAAVNVNIKAEPEFLNGSLSSPDQAVRHKARDLMLRAKEFARDIGVNKLTCCPLSDGFEFALQYDYVSCWQYMHETIKEVALYLPEVKLFIEPKPKETRASCFFSTVSRCILFIQQLNVPAVGVTLDLGHSIYAQQNPAEELVLLERCQIPYYIHTNDNDGSWDWDFFCGSHHLWEYAEFLFYLMQFNYSDFLTSDASPTRWDIKGFFHENISITEKICAKLQTLKTEHPSWQPGHEQYLQNRQLLRRYLFDL